MNKRDLIKKGYSFEKIGNGYYLDLSKRKRTVEEAEKDFKLVLGMGNIFLDNSTKKGKALSVILPLISQEDMTDLFSELYDLKNKSTEEKNEHRKTIRSA